MKGLLAFWKKDIINKLIIFVLFLLVAGGAGMVVLFFNLPGGKSAEGLFSQFFTSPTPTINVDAQFTSMAQTAIVAKTPAYLRGPATITPAYRGATPTPILEVTIAGSGEIASTATSSLSLQVSGTSFPTGSATTGADCLPAGTAKTGRVLEILDGINIKVMQDGLVYSVRLLGVELPGDAGYKEVASIFTSQAIWGKDVQLYTDPADPTSSSRLLRYIVLDDKLVNLELIRKGLGSAIDTPAGFACLQTFQEAEKTAREAKLGMWK